MVDVPPFCSCTVWNLNFPLLLQQKEKTRELAMGFHFSPEVTNSTSSLVSAILMALPNCKATRNVREDLECLMNIAIWSYAHL